MCGEVYLKLLLSETATGLDQLTVTVAHARDLKVWNGDADTRKKKKGRRERERERAGTYIYVITVQGCTVVQFWNPRQPSIVSHLLSSPVPGPKRSQEGVPDVFAIVSLDAARVMTERSKNGRFALWNQSFTFERAKLGPELKITVRSGSGEKGEWEKGGTYSRNLSGHVHEKDQY